MFCKKCGSSIKDGSGFCPKCGEKVSTVSNQAPGGMGPGMPWAGVQPVQMPAQKKPGLTDGQKKMIPIVAGVIVVLFLLIAVIPKLGRGGGEASYSLSGTWSSEDAVNLEKAISGLLSEEAGLDDWVIEGVMEVTGLSYLGDLTVTFDESGGLWIGGTGLSVSVGSFTYQKISDDMLMLKYALNVPIVGEIAVSYRAKYTLGKDRLTLDLFGVKAKFRRQE